MSEYGPSTYSSRHERTARSWWRTIVVAFLFLVLFAGLAGLGYLYWQTRQQLAYLSSPEGQEELARREAEEVLARLGELVVLPDEQDPIIATITDQEVLAAESVFYADAVNGDRLIIFPQAQRAYIYSPTRHRVVNIGPLAIEDEASLEAGTDVGASESDENSAAPSAASSSPTPAATPVTEAGSQVSQDQNPAE